MTWAEVSIKGMKASLLMVCEKNCSKWTKGYCVSEHWGILARNSLCVTWNWSGEDCLHLLRCNTQPFLVLCAFPTCSTDFLDKSMSLTYANISQEKLSTSKSKIQMYWKWGNYLFPFWTLLWLSDDLFVWVFFCPLILACVEYGLCAQFMISYFS